jgi:hypothetical protein
MRGARPPSLFASEGGGQLRALMGKRHASPISSADVLPLKRSVLVWRSLAALGTLPI